MKNVLTMLLIAALTTGFSACAPTETAEPAAPETTQPAAEEKPMESAPAEAPEAADPAEEAAAESAEETPAEPAEASEEPAPAAESAEPAWVSLFNGENLDGWTQRGAATWEVKDGVLTGTSPGGQGHIYAAPELTDLEVKGMFRITDQGGGANSGLYFRANPPEDNVDGYPNGYEAQIRNSEDAFTGWLWKPGAPTGEATKLLTEDGEWFSMRVKAVGSTIQIWVKDELVMTYEDDEYKKGYFALQCHNEGMTVEAKELYYRDLSAK